MYSNFSKFILGVLLASITFSCIKKKYITDKPTSNKSLKDTSSPQSKSDYILEKLRAFVDATIEADIRATKARTNATVATASAKPNISDAPAFSIFIYFCDSYSTREITNSTKATIAKVSEARKATEIAEDKINTSKIAIAAAKIAAYTAHDTYKVESNTKEIESKIAIAKISIDKAAVAVDSAIIAVNNAVITSKIACADVETAFTSAKVDINSSKADPSVKTTTNDYIKSYINTAKGIIVANKATLLTSEATKSTIKNAQINMRYIQNAFAKKKARFKTT
ncbi:hypothetical protein [Ichthyobacterium seriolicida]|nr:hypothetical protein [Ichthyobacterium seriolicida]